MLSKAGHIEVEYDKDVDALYLSTGDDPYESNMIVVYDVEEAVALITALKDFIETKRSKITTTIY